MAACSTLAATMLAATAASATTRPLALRSAVPLANSCFALESLANHRFVALAGPSSYSATAATPAKSTRFFLKPTGLGTYMLLDSAGELLAVSSGNTIGPPNESVTRTMTPGRAAEWRIVHRRGATFTIGSTAAAQQLAASPALVLRTKPGGAGAFGFVRASRCVPYPEAQVGATGTPFAGTNPDGTVYGFADYHMHLTANFRAGGRVIYGESFDPFGITVALGAPGDEQDHGANGSLDVTGNLIRSGNPAGTHDPHGWPTFAGWPVHNTVTHQQIYWVWLERAWMAGLRLIVAQTAEDVELCAIEPLRSHSCNETDSITLQIQTLRALQNYIDAQNGGRGRGWFRLVYTPAQARRVIERGKLAVVIGVESSNPFGCSEYRGTPRCSKSDIDRGIALYRRLGIRSFFITHWVDNAFAGVAIQGGAEGTLLNGLNKMETGEYYSAGPCPLPGEGETMVSAGHYYPGKDWVSRLLDQAQSQAVPTYPPGKLCNTKGLTSLGRYLVLKMIAAHMLIDVDHLSERARESVLAIAEAHHYPLVSSHTGTGGFWPAQDLKRLYALGGLATARSDTAPNVIARIRSLAPYRSRRYYFGVGFGTDTGGFNSQPPPPADGTRNPVRYPFRSVDGRVSFVRQRSGQRRFDLNADGVAHYGLLADLIQDMRQHRGGSRATSLLFRSAEAYLEMWQRAFRTP